MGRVAIFDLDGTLIDSNERLENELRVAMKRLGVSVTPSDLRKGHENKYALAAKYGFSPEDLDSAYRYRDLGGWRDALEKGEVKIFPKTKNVLESLLKGGVNLGLLTRTFRTTDAMRKIQHFGLQKYFGRNIWNVGSTGTNKNEGALKLLERIPNYSDVYTIGDRMEDVAIADYLKDKGITASGIYLNSKGKMPQELKHHHLVKTLSEIPPIILKPKI